jgi:hypothetical protein
MPSLLGEARQITANNLKGQQLSVVLLVSCGLHRSLDKLVSRRCLWSSVLSPYLVFNPALSDRLQNGSKSRCAEKA